MFVTTKNQAKAKADTLHKFLAEKGIAVPKSEMLNAVARMAGLEDWNALSAEFRPEAIDQQLKDIELDHIKDAIGNTLDSFGEELYIQTASGFWLVSGAYGPMDYIRVCDPLGREVVYWSEDEFRDDPGCVLGAMMGVLNRGRSDKMPDFTNPVADKITFADRTPKPKKRRGLAELGWEKVSRICVGTYDARGEDGPGVYYDHKTYHAHEEDVLCALDAEREGTASPEDIEFLNESADDIVLDWGDEFEGEGLTTKELRGIQMAPAGTWKLADGRVLAFMQMIPME